MIFRFRCEKLGKHWYCKVSSAPAADQTFAGIGRLVMDDRDFESIKKLGREVELGRADGRGFYCFEVTPDTRRNHE